MLICLKNGCQLFSVFFITVTANESEACCEDDDIEALTSRAVGERNELSTEEKLQNVSDQCALDQNISKTKSQ